MMSLQNQPICEQRRDDRVSHKCDHVNALVTDVHQLTDWTRETAS
jgi:hypothetical protein